MIGAFALSAHAIVRASSDVDALLHISYPRLTKLSSMFKSAGFATTLRSGDTDDPILGMLILGDSHGNRVDLPGGLRGLDTRVFSRAIEVTFLNEIVRVVGREDFIAMKCFAGGGQDVADARSAYQAAQGPVDLDLLRTTTRRFGRDAADKLEEILAH